MTTFIHRRSNAARIAALTFLATLLAFGTGCERSPEDLEGYRDTRGGQQQIAQWIQDDGESMEVRKRGIQILVEDGQFHKLADVLDGIEDDDERAQIASAALPTAKEMWEVQDFPQITDEMLQEGGSITPDGVTAIHAVNALYRLTPHMEDDSREEAQHILRDWISADQDIRTQWGDVRIPFIVPVAGEGAVDEIANWLMEVSEPHRLAASLRDRIDDDGELYRLDEILGARANEDHPNVSEDLIAAIQDAQTEGILPYLEKAVTDPESSGTLFQIAIETYFEIDTEEARNTALQVVEEIPGTFRWVAIQELVKANGLAVIPEIADALPADEDAYDEDELRGRPNSNCQRIASAIDDGDYDEDPELVADLLASDHWPAQVFGLRCAQQLGIAELRETVQDLHGDRTPIAGWRDGKTIGELAEDVNEEFAEAE